MTRGADSRLAAVALTVSLAALALATVLWGGREGRAAQDTGSAAGVSRAVEAPAVARPVLPSPPGVQASGAPPRAPAPRPVEVQVAAVGIRMPVVPKGVRTNGEMALPPRPDRLGWYRYGPAPTERGSTVLAGHVDSGRYGIGPLARLRAVDVGDRLVVRLVDGSVLRYRTVGVRVVDKQSRALRSAFATTGPPRLRIVTCGGEFDPDRGGYQDNVVLTAEPVSGAAAR